MNTELKPEQFRHKTIVKVRFHEVDMLGVCNNAVYVNYLEHARLEYIKETGLIPNEGLFSDGRLFYVVRNEINYISHAKYDEELTIYTRVSFIKNSSFGFDHIILKSDGKAAAEGKGVVVHVDPLTGKSTQLPDYVYSKISDYDKNVYIIRQT